MRMKRPFQSVLGYLDSGRCVYTLVGFGLLLRLTALAALSRHPLRGDARAYHEMAVQLLNKETFSPFWPPGVPYYLLLIYRTFGDESAFIARASVLVFYVLTMLLLYLLVKEMSSRKAANVAVLVFSLYPTHIYHSIEPYTQLPVAACLLSIVYFTIAVCVRKSRLCALALGCVLGAVTLMRPSSVLLVIVVPAYLFLRTRRIWTAAVPFLISLTLVSAWLLKAHEMTGRFVMINDANAANLFYGNNPYTPLYKTWWFGSHRAGEVDVPQQFVEMRAEIESYPPETRNRLYRQMAFRHILSRPDLFLVRTLNRIRAYFAFDTYAGSFFIKGYGINKPFGLAVISIDAVFFCSIMVAALLLLACSEMPVVRSEPVVVSLGIAVTYAVPYWVAFSHPTYHFPVVPLFGVLAATFIGRIVSYPSSELFRPVMLSAKRKRGLLFALAVFFYIQVEWVVVMFSRI